MPSPPICFGPYSAASGVVRLNLIFAKNALLILDCTDWSWVLVKWVMART